MWFNRSSHHYKPYQSSVWLCQSISQQIHNYPHEFPSIFRGWEGSDTLISNDEWLWMVARRPSTTKWKVIIQTNIWYHWYYILATLSVMFACHPIWRGHPPSRDPWRHVKTHYRRVVLLYTRLGVRIVPIFLDTLLQILSMWWLQLSQLSIITPRNLVVTISEFSCLCTNVHRNRFDGFLEQCVSAEN